MTNQSQPNEFLLKAAEQACTDLKNMSNKEFIQLQESCGDDIAYAIDPTIRNTKKNPPWFIVEDGFEGHQGHWADCFFSNATIDNIIRYLNEEGEKWELREMTDEEVAKYPEIIEFSKQLIVQYGYI